MNRLKRLFFSIFFLLNLQNIHVDLLKEVIDVTTATVGPRHLNRVCLKARRHDVQNRPASVNTSRLLGVVVHAEAVTKTNLSLD